MTTYKQAIPNHFNILAIGSPGVGKTDVGKRACAEIGWEVMVTHPAVDDPTDYKGLPYGGRGIAEFLPYPNLKRLMETQENLVWFIDDLGMANESVQKAIMQILLSRHINEHKISDKVSIIAATNRKSDRAGVAGVLSTVRSRFVTGIKQEVSVEDWTDWAMEKGMPAELIYFNKFRPNHITEIKPTSDLEGFSCPRTMADVGMMMNAGMFSLHSFDGARDFTEYDTMKEGDKKGGSAGYEFELIAGAVGEACAAEFIGFLRVMHDLPTVEDVERSPDRARVPVSPAARYAITYALSHNINKDNADPFIRYMGRLGKEFELTMLKGVQNLTDKGNNSRKAEVITTRAFLDWMTSHTNSLI